MSSKYVDLTAIMQIIGCVFNNPSILSYDDKYKIYEEDFPDQFHKIVFGSIYKLYESGSNKITLNNIIDYLAGRPKNAAIFNKQKGDEWLTKVSGIANESTFDYYYNRLKKMTLLRAYDNHGINVKDIYDPDNILDIKKKELQENMLDNTSLIGIAEQVEKKIEAIRYEYTSSANENSYQAGDSIFELLEDLKIHPEVGVPLYGPLVNTVTRGARLKKFYLRSAPTGIGKAIPNDTLIPTPIGWRCVCDIQPGDYLFGQNGKPTKVLQIHPQISAKQKWRITFIDGREAICCKDHLWEYRYETHRGYALRVEDTKTIYNRSLNLKNGFRNSNGHGYRFAIKLNEAVEYPKQDLKVDPYLMGLALGDGSFRYDNSQKSFAFSTKDEELAQAIGNILNCQPYKSSEYNFNWTFKPYNNLQHNLWVEEIFKDYPELWQTKSETKFIPKIYLLGSIEQRYALLQGLMDTDGSIESSKGRLTYTTVSPQLRDDLIELCHSLGFIATYGVETNRSAKYTTGECYNIHIQCKKNIKPQVFRLSRKVKIAETYANNGKREEYKEFNSIINIEPLNEYVEMTCFTVDNNDHLFLMNDYIVTHNTRSMIADACYIACNKIYDEYFGWIKTGVAQPTVYITTEQELGEIQTMMLAFLANVNEEHIIDGKYIGDEEDRVMEAANILQNSPLYVEVLPDFSLQDIEDIIKKNIRDHGVNYIFHDYVHTSLKILEEITRRSGGVKLREDNILFMLSIRLKDLCNKYGIFIMSATQLNSDYQDSETPDQNLLRGAKSIADKIDFGGILLPVKQKDIDSLETILANNAFETPTIKMSVYKNRRGRYKGIYLWCKSDLGTCRIKPMFATGWDYGIIQMDDLKIKVEEESAF